MDRLEKIFFNLDYSEECHELVQLLSLNDNECEERFLSDKTLYQKYFPENINEKANVVSVKEPETEESDSEEEEAPIKHQVRMDRESYKESYAEGSSNRSNRRSKATEFSMPYHKGIPNPKTGSSSTIDTINIDNISSLEIRQQIIDKWNTEISLII